MIKSWKDCTQWEAPPLGDDVIGLWRKEPSGEFLWCSEPEIIKNIQKGESAIFLYDSQYPWPIAKKVMGDPCRVPTEQEGNAIMQLKWPTEGAKA